MEICRYEYEDHVLICRNNVAANSFGVFFNPGLGCDTPNGIKLSCASSHGETARGPNDDLQLPNHDRCNLQLSGSAKGTCFNCTVPQRASTDPKDREHQRGRALPLGLRCIGLRVPTFTARAPPGAITSGMALTAVEYSRHRLPIAANPRNLAPSREGFQPLDAHIWFRSYPPNRYPTVARWVAGTQRFCVLCQHRATGCARSWSLRDLITTVRSRRQRVRPSPSWDSGPSASLLRYLGRSMGVAKPPE